MQLSAQPNGNAEANSRAPLPDEGNTRVRTKRTASFRCKRPEFTEQGVAPMQLSAQPNGNAEANSRAPLPDEGNTRVRIKRSNHTYL
jgi:hypothetical protein